ncbi:MAG: transglycosylase SLT domain-containing protein, partial [Pusillimonas sp.]
MQIGSGAALGRAFRSLRHQLSELVHVCAVYLGLAALVTFALSVTVPALREQTREVHTALLASLKPAVLQDDLLAGGRLFSTDHLLPGGETSASEVPEPPGVGDQSFSQVLAGTDTFAVPGVSRAQSQALRSYIARKYRIAHKAAGVLIQNVFRVAKEFDLDPQLILAVIAIESRYNPFAESSVGAQGLMQVMTRVHKDKFEQFADGPDAALNPLANIQVGSRILRDCI